MYAVTALYYSCGLTYGTKGKRYAYYLARPLDRSINFEEKLQICENLDYFANVSQTSKWN